LNGKIGDYVTIARKKKDAWYIGSITDENARDFTFKLDFLDEKINYEATIYKDGPSADWKTNPLEYNMERKLVKKDDELVMKLAAGGGQAVVIRPND
jgi:alpha-glucosidase